MTTLSRLISIAKLKLSRLPMYIKLVKTNEWFSITSEEIAITLSIFVHFLTAYFALLKISQYQGYYFHPGYKMETKDFRDTGCYKSFKSSHFLY